MRAHGICLATFIILTTASDLRVAAAAEAVAVLGEAEQRFPAFCDSWMRRLAAREEFNQRNIKWRERGSEVEGVYIGYSSDHTCTVKTSKPTGVPVGRMVYHEYRYRKRGSAADTAAASKGEVVDKVEITEIFRYTAAGEWVY